ncbi:MAG: MoaD/ThiS family protein [Ardenticatenaceae bacterium]
MAMVLVPTPLRRLTGGKRKVSVEGATINDVIEQLEANYPGVKKRLLNKNGDIKRFINVFVDGEDIRGEKGDGANTAVGVKSEISIIPAMAGG